MHGKTQQGSYTDKRKSGLHLILFTYLLHNTFTYRWMEEL